MENKKILNSPAKKRNRTELIADILTIIQERGGKIKPTHLMYKANLSHVSMKSYLDELEKGSLVKKVSAEKDSSKILIEITPKGKEFTTKYSQVREFEKTFGL